LATDGSRFTNIPKRVDFIPLFAIQSDTRFSRITFCPADFSKRRGFILQNDTRLCQRGPKAIFMRSHSS
jgi:hypothetical protein